MSRRDELRSLVRRMGDQAKSSLNSGPMAAARKLLSEVAARQAKVSDEALTRAIAHAEGVREASVSCQGGRIRIDATFDDGKRVELGLVPWDVRFAPRGAKEVVFRIEPAELGRDRHVPELVAAVATVVAHTLWSVALAFQVICRFLPFAPLSVLLRVPISVPWKLTAVPEMPTWLAPLPWLRMPSWSSTRLVLLR